MNDNLDLAAIQARYEAIKKKRATAMSYFISANDVPALLSEVKRLTAERDAAVRDLQKAHVCSTCKSFTPPDNDHLFGTCKEKARLKRLCAGELFEWRGVPTAVRLTNKEDAE